MEHGDLAALLPEEVLADVLHRVAAPRWLAVSRCVCKAWRAIVDSEGLLHTELPFSGIFLYFVKLPFPEFFSRPPSPCRPVISGKLDFLCPGNNVHSDMVRYRMKDHCNGLLLIKVYDANKPDTDNTYVVNPATRCWDTLPSCPPTNAIGTVSGVFFYNHYLSFDPTASSHYLVFRIPYLFSLESSEDEFDPLVEASEWPPSLYKLAVFSSRKRRWEERLFVRAGPVVGTVGKTRDYYIGDQLSSVYWRGSLYVHCQTNFTMRISQYEDKYRVIMPPANLGARPYLGRSENGVYLTSFVQGQIQIFVLNESWDQPEWIHKHDYDLNPIKLFGGQGQGSWILEDINDGIFNSSLGEIDKDVVQETFQWNSDNDDFDDNRDVIEAQLDRHGHIDILGFHPYKEILFMCSSSTYESTATGFAYHLKSFKVERLGSIYPTAYDDFVDSGQCDERWDIICFPYTPCCWIEKFPKTEN